MTDTLLANKPSTMTRDRFVSTFGGVYEHSPWVAERTWDRGLTEAHDHAITLADAMAETLAGATRAEQMDLILAHPDLAGKAAVAGELTDASTGEQASAGLDQCSRDEFEKFQTLNNAYKEKFGFPFIMAVKGSNRFKILAAFEERLPNDPETEFATALEQINKIARLRLNDL